MAGRQDMSKIRINELARELEVKPNVILDMLPELGVADKKTHSSSLDDDVVLALRHRLSGEPPPTPSEQAALPIPSGAPRPAPPTPEPVSFKAEPAAPPPAAKEPEKEAVADGNVIPSRVVPPLRPPLATGSPIVPPLTPGQVPRGIPIPAPPAPPPPRP